MKISCMCTFNPIHETMSFFLLYHMLNYEKELLREMLGVNVVTTLYYNNITLNFYIGIYISLGFALTG
jgi:hypothetical protein